MDGVTVVTVIEPNGRSRNVNIKDEEDALKELQRLVGGYIEVVPLVLYDCDNHAGKRAVVDGEARMKGAVINPTAMDVLGSLKNNWAELFGTVVIVPEKLL